MASSGSSPFGRSQLMRRSPPPSPNEQDKPIDPTPPAPTVHVIPAEVIPTSEIQKWMSTIESILSEVCSIVAEGKMNADQKIRVTNLCRKVTSGTSQMAVLYQSLTHKTTQAYTTIEHLTEKQGVVNSLQQFKEVVESKMKPAETTSFADMVKKGTDNYIRPANLSSIAIYHSDKSKTSDDTKSLVQEIISPEELKLHVRSVRKVRNGGVIISTDNRGDIEKLRKSEKLVSSGLTVEEPTKRRPRVAVIGVPTALTEQEVFECIFEQNLSEKLPNTTSESLLAAMKLSHKSGKKNMSTCNYILELPANIRRILIDQGRIFINWTSCPVRDFTTVTRCFNCQQFGHAAKYCRENSSTCNHCGETGHSFKDCGNKNAPHKCATCNRFKRKSDHKTGDASCPARKFAEENYINSIDYEGA